MGMVWITVFCVNKNDLELILSLLLSMNLSTPISVVGVWYLSAAI